MVKESKETLFKQAEMVLQLAQQLTKRIEGTDAGYEGDRDAWFEKGGAYMLIAGIFLYSATDDFKTVFLLLDKELFNGAFLAFRRLFELNVDLRFIGKHPKKRAKEFLMFNYIQQEKLIQLLEKHWQHSMYIDKGKRSAISTSYNDAMNTLGYKKPPLQWSHTGWSDKCKEIGWEKQYDIAYRLCCMYTHPSARGLGAFFKDLPGIGLTYMDPVELLPIIAPIAIACLLDIITNANRTLNAKMDEEITQAYQRLKGRGWVHL